jgi:LacI family transcriptional regulator
MPVVFYAHNPKSLPASALSVSHDSAETARAAAKELMTTGFENFAFIPFERKTYWSEERKAAFISALKLNGRECRVFDTGSRHLNQTERQIELRRFLSSLERPCAVFAANDMTAADVVTAARFENIDIPNELAIIGVDNYEHICEHTTPPLSSIEPDFRLGGRIAATMLLAAIKDGGRFSGERHRSFGPLRIVHRATTRLLSLYDKHVSLALELIRNEACSGLTANKVAKLFPYSRRLADTRFRQATGHSILEEIHSIQLERAKQILLESDRQIKSISDFCGFKHPNSLRKFFLKETGMTLRSWREKHLNKTLPDDLPAI